MPTPPDVADGLRKNGEIGALLLLVLIGVSLTFLLASEWRWHITHEVGNLLEIEFGSDSHRVQTERPAQHRSGNAAVVDCGWIGGAHEIVAAKVIGDSDELRFFQRCHSRHDAAISLIGVMLTALDILHVCFSPSTRLERGAGALSDLWRVCDDSRAITPANRGIVVSEFGGA